jgi:hypothetical protein
MLMLVHAALSRPAAVRKEMVQKICSILAEVEYTLLFICVIVVTVL